MATVQEQIDAIIARANSVITEVDSYSNTVNNLAEPNTDNVTTDFVTFTATAQTAYTVESSGTLSLSSSNTSIDDIAEYTRKFNAVEITINDDSVGSITPPYTGGQAFLTADPTDPKGAEWSTQIYYDVGSSLDIIQTTVGVSPTFVFGSFIDVTTSNVTGTTGTNGRVTIAAQSNTLKIENRSGSTITYHIKFL